MTTPPPSPLALSAPLDAFDSYVERHLGKRWARVVALVMIVAVVCAALALIGSIIGPVGGWAWGLVKGRPLPALPPLPTVLPAALSLVVVVVLLVLYQRSMKKLRRELEVIAGYLDDNVHPRLEKVEGPVLDYVDKYLREHHFRLEHLEQSSPDAASVNHALKRLHERLVIMEPNAGPADLSLSDFSIWGNLSAPTVEVVGPPDVIPDADNKD